MLATRMLKMHAKEVVPVCMFSSIAECWFFVELNPPSLRLYAMAKCRAKNEAQPQDLVKLLRANFERLDSRTYLVSEIEDVAIAHADFLVDALKVTARPTALLLEKAALKAYDRLKPSDAAAWGRQVAAAVKFCRDKLKGLRSGVKLHAEVRRVCLALKHGPGTADSQDQTASSNVFQHILRGQGGEMGE